MQPVKIVRRSTLVHKANILKMSGKLLLDAGHLAAEQYPDIEFEDKIIDNMSMQLVSQP